MLLPNTKWSSRATTHSAPAVQALHSLQLSQFWPCYALMDVFQVSASLPASFSPYSKPSLLHPAFQWEPEGKQMCMFPLTGYSTYTWNPSSQPKVVRLGEDSQWPKLRPTSPPRIVFWKIKTEKILHVIHLTVCSGVFWSDLIWRALMSPHLLFQHKGKLIRIGKVLHITTW